ncbi:hypothetical protein PROFUN_16491, partial [Planoprotostelium fungivorum]
HNETVHEYTNKINRLGGKVDAMMAYSSRSMLQHVGATLLIFLITAISYIAVGAFKVINITRRNLGVAGESRRLESRITEILDKQKSTLSEYTTQNEAPDTSTENG